MPRKTPQKLLEIKDLQVSFVRNEKNIKAVDSVCLDVYDGETLGLVGESGSGKTVTALSILKLIQDPERSIKSGSILFAGQNLLTCETSKLQKIRGNEISMIFQDPSASLNPVFAIGEQVEEVLLAHDKCQPIEASKFVKLMFDKVGLPSSEKTLKCYPHELSGGMKQRAMIAMALCTKPKLLIADEPTTSLDSTIRLQILRLLEALAGEFGMSILFISHDLSEVARVADRIAVMYAGAIVEVGPGNEIMNRPRHPYTLGLINSIPKFDGKAESLSPIPGQPPEPDSSAEGCAFAPRCLHCMPVCRTKKPEMISLESDVHDSCCHLNDPRQSTEGWPL